MSQEHFKKRILLIDSDVSFCKAIAKELARLNYSLTIFHMPKPALEHSKTSVFDLVVCEQFIYGLTGLNVLEEIKRLMPKAKLVLTSLSPNVRAVVQSIKNGIDNFFVKPFIASDIERILNQDAVGFTSIEDNRPFVEVVQNAYWDTCSPAMKDVLNEIDTVAGSDYSIIIYGESGTGKEMIARRIHAKSGRSEAPFVAVDCGTLTRELAGSVFFGHMKGSFTGASEDRAGCFEVAEGGTLFLDEIGNLPLDIQVYLLRAIQEKKLRRIGGSREQQFNVRILVASNIDLKLACRLGRFREDLFYRLNEFRIDIPSLRERKEDIVPLCRFFIQQACVELDKELLTLDKVVEHFFSNYGWPGNLRELRNVIRRCTLLAKENCIDISCLPVEIMFTPDPDPQNYENIFEDADTPENPTNLKEVVRLREKKMIMQTLFATKYNKTKTALLLNIDRKTLYNKMNEFDIPQQL